jgi:glycerol-3-phosphate dehydrogenase
MVSAKVTCATCAPGGERYGGTVKDVAIVGGGVVGCAIARELSRYRLDVCLFEREVEVGFGTSKANSGIIHGGHHTASGTLKADLVWRGNRMWRDLAGELGFGFLQNGDLTVAFDDEELRTLEEIEAIGAERGVTGLELWSPDRIHREEPNVSREALGALLGPTAAVVNPYEACFALIDDAVDNGVELRVGTSVDEIEVADDHLVIFSDGDRTPVRAVINAAGLFADHISRMVGLDDLVIGARKGEEYLLDKRLSGIVEHTIFPCPTPTSKGVLVIPTFDGTIMVGPTADTVDDKEDLSTTTEGASQVFDMARRLVPGISERDCIAEFAGLRAIAPNDDFVIGPTAVPGFINVAGIQSPGLTAAPAIAEMIVGVLVDSGLDLDPKPDLNRPAPRPVRVSELTVPELEIQAFRDPRYAHVVCRCELVTEGEIADAIDRGARTLDGLKFRTRAGMGRCQGGFCTSRCMQLLADAADGPMSEVTKRGPGSWIVREREDVV